MRLNNITIVIQVRLQPWADREVVKTSKHVLSTYFSTQCQVFNAITLLKK